MYLVESSLKQRFNHFVMFIYRTRIIKWKGYKLLLYFVMKLKIYNLYKFPFLSYDVAKIVLELLKLLRKLCLSLPTGDDWTLVNRVPKYYTFVLVFFYCNSVLKS